MHGHKVSEAFTSIATGRRPFQLLATVAPPRSALGVSDCIFPAYQRLAKSLLPVFSRFGAVEVVEYAQSSLPYRALVAAQRGHRPVHLALAPPHAGYFSPVVPTIAFPLWHLVDVPTRSCGVDPPGADRSWAQVLGLARLVLAANPFTQGALQRATDRPVVFVPPPVSDWLFLVEPWMPDRTVILETPHVIWPAETPDAGPADLEPLLRVRTLPWWQRVGFAIARKTYDGIRSRLSPRLRNKLKRSAVRLVNRARRGEGLRRSTTVDPRAPAPALRLEGLVYLSTVESVDDRQNLRDLVSAFLLAFRERTDATLVLQVVGDLDQRPSMLSAVHELYHSFRVRHRCRIAVLTADLSSVEQAELLAATTYCVTASRAEAAAGSVQDALAAGRPVIAPIHSAFLGLLDEQVCLPIGWHSEPTHWPHDPQRHLESTWARLVWPDLVAAFQASARLAEQAPLRYRAMSHAARRRAYSICSLPVAERAVAEALARLTIETPFGASGWAA